MTSDIITYLYYFVPFVKKKCHPISQKMPWDPSWKWQFFYYHFNRIDLIFICEVFSLQITDQEIVVELGLFEADYLSHQSSTFAQI